MAKPKQKGRFKRGTHGASLVMAIRDLSWQLHVAELFAAVYSIAVWVCRKIGHPTTHPHGGRESQTKIRGSKFAGTNDKEHLGSPPTFCR